MKSPYQNFAVFDVETGGLLNGGVQAVYEMALTEIAIVIVSPNLEIIDQDTWLIRLYEDDLIFTQKAEEVSHISKQMCENEGMDIRVAQKEVKKFLQKHKVGSAKPSLVGHNVLNFDSYFIENFFEYCGDDIFKYVKPNKEGKKAYDLIESVAGKLQKEDPESPLIDELVLAMSKCKRVEYFDTLEMARQKWGEATGYSLAACLVSAGTTLLQAHRALPDTVATAKLFILFMKGLREELGGKAVEEVKTERFRKNFEF
jgi:DNA polymerase III alpha subunit (gram-positive type)